MRKLLLTFALLVLSVPAFGEGKYSDPNEDWLPKGIDWDLAEEVVVELGDNNFEPDTLTFKKNKVYKLIANNVGKVAHDIFGTDFYHSVVLNRIIVNDVVVRTPHIHSVYLKPKAKLVMWFVPVKSGEFEVICTLPGHKEDGMLGSVTVE